MISKKELIQLDRFKFKIFKIKDLDYSLRISSSPEPLKIYKSDFSPDSKKKKYLGSQSGSVSLFQLTTNIPLKAF